MTAELLSENPRTWGGEFDDEGYATYTAEFIVRCDSAEDGPDTVLNCAGLPTYGSSWAFGNDSNTWAYRTAGAKAKKLREERNKYIWVVSVKYTTKPIGKKACYDQQVQNPLLQPPKITIGSVRDKIEATHDRFGDPILSSSHEMLRGTHVEFDKNRGVVKIELNVPILDMILLDRLINCVNDSYMWGFPPRCVKLSSYDVDIKYYGMCCVYYTLKLEFDLAADTFDRKVLDEGNKVLHGRWTSIGHWELLAINNEPPDPNNPAHFDRFVDKSGNPMRAVLDGHGLPAGVCIDEPSTAASFDYSPSPAYYVQIIASSTGVSLNDDEVWLRLNSVLPAAWSDTEPYIRGDVVSYNTFHYVALNGSVGVPPSESLDRWKNVNLLSNQGVYSASTTYGIGDYVSNEQAHTNTSGSASGSSSGTGSCTPTEEGFIDVEYYKEDNLFLLGVPATF